MRKIIWEREPISKSKPGFYLQVWVEGYRPCKDQWEHEVIRFDTFDEALERYEELSWKTWDERDKYFGPSYEGTGIHSVSLENLNITEIDEFGNKWKWNRILNHD